MKILYYFALIIFSIVLMSASCKDKTNQNNTTPVVSMKIAGLYDSLQKNQPCYKTFSAKFNADYRKGTTNFSIGGNLRIRRDSAIWMTLSPGLGIEVGRSLLTKDSVKVLNRVQSTFFVGNYSILDTLLNISLDYAMIQSLITDEIYLYPRTQFNSETLSKYTVEQDSGEIILSSLDPQKYAAQLENNFQTEQVKPVFQQLYIDAATHKVKQIIVKDFKQNRELVIDYKDFVSVDNMLFPTLIQTTFTQKDITATVNFMLEKITLNQTLTFPFQIPSKYTKMK